MSCCGKDTTKERGQAILDIVDADTISSNTFNEPSLDYIFKYIIIGEFSVGKTCLLMRFQDGTFREEYESTIGVEFGTKNVQIQDTLIKLRIWDTAGSEKFRCITRGYFRGSIGAIIVYDISNRSTFEHIDEWVQELEKYNSSNYVLMIIGNKCDSSQRTVTTDEGKDKAKKLNAEFFECSAKTGENIEKAFMTLTELVLRDVSSGKISLENN
ncbi:GTP-binding protein YPTC4, putative [Entamoeba dispar SAW760]|uniref:GTP-binding protein YPTC4, putative n=1 Tax=Entamoeba dispar (strain ATCC PRA-260 / SAW760) TaxID=370354 RepID=B0ELP0_ENTDS|nr:GTP-binding protein YPTC4, putative [Entamoeba dispar SAW760]EDR24571.1 GTP-binding protein YPTC4, putative [Entamoeba dispar SAW760]|eukprot:EDR24571.1 GTP-binding protein YPTC4, putative [Entamoeba dispar SAW760]